MLVLVLALGLSAAPPGALAAEIGGSNALSELTEGGSEGRTTTTTDENDDDDGILGRVRRPKSSFSRWRWR